jgi:hypothetical protein
MMKLYEFDLAQLYNRVFKVLYVSLACTDTFRVENNHVGRENGDM